MFCFLNYWSIDLLSAHQGAFKFPKTLDPLKKIYTLLLQECKDRRHLLVSTLVFSKNYCLTVNILKAWKRYPILNWIGKWSSLHLRLNEDFIRELKSWKKKGWNWIFLGSFQSHFFMKLSDQVDVEKNEQNSNFEVHLKWSEMTWHRF